jgi:hypothetical protein
MSDRQTVMRDSTKRVLEYLGQEEWSRLGECGGSDLCRLVALGLAVIEPLPAIGPDVVDPDRATVRLTKAGFDVLAAFGKEGL